MIPRSSTQAIAQRSHQHILLDMDQIARRAGAMVNAVMLGALAGCGRLPIPLEAFEAAIRRDGKAVESNLRGFRAGLAAARDPAPSAPAPAAGRCRRAAGFRARDRGAAGRGPRCGDGGHAAARTLPGCRLCAALSRPAGADRGGRCAGRCRRPPPGRDRAAAGAAHVLRGCGQGGAGQDRSGALRTHRGRDRARVRASRSR